MSESETFGGKVKKTLRINTEMRFINNRQQFTVANLMEEFNISRSTAFRDLDEIQALGLPLYANSGHNGGFSVIRNQTLPAVTFTPIEIEALFVSFLSTTNMQLPYLQNRKTITEKLLSIIPEKLQKELLNLQNLIWFENTNPSNSELLELSDQAPLILSKLISKVIQNHQIRIKYQKPNQSKPEWREVYVLHLYNRQMNWYAECFDLVRQAKRNFRVDRMLELSDSEEELIASTDLNDVLKKNEPEPNLIIRLGSDAIKKFKQMHRPGRHLIFLDQFQQSARFLDHVDAQPSTIKMYADWLLFLGEDIEIEEIPPVVLTEIRSRFQKWN